MKRDATIWDLSVISVCCPRSGRTEMDGHRIFGEMQMLMSICNYRGQPLYFKQGHPTCKAVPQKKRKKKVNKALLLGTGLQSTFFFFFYCCHPTIISSLSITSTSDNARHQAGALFAAARATPGTSFSSSFTPSISFVLTQHPPPLSLLSVFSFRRK